MLADQTKEAYPHATLLISTLNAYNSSSDEVLSCLMRLYVCFFGVVFVMLGSAIHVNLADSTACSVLKCFRSVLFTVLCCFWYCFLCGFDFNSAANNIISMNSPFVHDTAQLASMSALSAPMLMTASRARVRKLIERAFRDSKLKWDAEGVAEYVNDLVAAVSAFSDGVR